MVLKSFIFSAILGCALLYFGYVQCKDPPLTPYGKKVKSLLSDDTFNKTFNANVKDDDQLKEATKKAADNFNKIIGIENHDSEEEKIDEEEEDVKKLTSEVYFHAQTYAIARCFRELGKLDDDNIDDKAQEFADKLDDAAKDVTDADDFVQTFVAQTTATAHFYKDNGVTSKEDIEKCVKYLRKELKKYKNSEDS